MIRKDIELNDNKTTAQNQQYDNSELALTNLPAEVLVNIFSNLGLNESLRTARTCKFFKGITSDTNVLKSQLQKAGFTGKELNDHLNSFQKRECYMIVNLPEGIQTMHSGNFLNSLKQLSPDLWKVKYHSLYVTKQQAMNGYNSCFNAHKNLGIIKINLPIFIVQSLLRQRAFSAPFTKPNNFLTIRELIEDPTSAEERSVDLKN